MEIVSARMNFQKGTAKASFQNQFVLQELASRKQIRGKIPRNPFIVFLELGFDWYNVTLS